MVDGGRVDRGEVVRRGGGGADSALIQTRLA